MDQREILEGSGYGWGGECTPPVASASELGLSAWDWLCWPLVPLPPFPPLPLSLDWAPLLSGAWGGGPEFGSGGGPEDVLVPWLPFPARGGRLGLLPGLLPLPGLGLGGESDRICT